MALKHSSTQALKHSSIALSLIFSSILFISGCGSSTSAAIDCAASDFDGDHISDLAEGRKLGCASAQLTPAKNGIKAQTVSNLDSDGDGSPNYQDTDSDNDGTPDGTESGCATQTTLCQSASLPDTDGDGVPDYADATSSICPAGSTCYTCPDASALFTNINILWADGNLIGSDGSQPSIGAWNNLGFQQQPSSTCTSASNCPSGTAYIDSQNYYWCSYDTALLVTDSQLSGNCKVTPSPGSTTCFGIFANCQAVCTP